METREGEASKSPRNKSSALQYKGHCKVKKIKKIPKKMDRAQPTQPPPSKLIFLETVTDMDRTLKS